MAPDAELTPGRAFYRRQIALLEAADIDGLMGQYQPDATLLNYDTCVTGTAALREFFVGYLAALGSIRLKSTDKFAESPTRSSSRRRSRRLTARPGSTTCSPSRMAVPPITMQA